MSKKLNIHRTKVTEVEEKVSFELEVNNNTLELVATNLETDEDRCIFTVESDGECNFHTDEAEEVGLY